MTQGDLDEAFDYAEQAMLDHRVDTGLLGIVTGLTVSAQGTPNLTVNVAAGIAYDNEGNRILVGGTQVVNLAASQPAGVGASRIVSVCIRFDRTLSDPRVDDNSVTIQYQRAESFEIYLVAGSEVVGVPSAPAKPSDGLVLADVLLNQADTAIVSGDINMTTTGRRDWSFDIAVGGLPTLQVGSLTEVVTSNRQILADHIADLTVPHAASSIGFTDPGTGSAATNVQAALNALISGSTPFVFSNSGGYSFNDGTVIFDAACDAVEFQSGPTILFSGVTNFEDQVILQGTTSILGSGLTFTGGRGGALQSTPLATYQTQWYEFALANQGVTGATNVGVISMSDNTSALVKVTFVACRVGNASIMYSHQIVSRVFRNGGAPSISNIAALTASLDGTAGDVVCGLSSTGSNLQFEVGIAANNYNVTAFVELTSIPE